ncbi:DUF2690 domain-containing protein [Nocardia xishanensis]|uniref:DUF2690 domain-containing protein n=1 Tax=Nocardia xishanensis TaxID=238964 RepID=UPI000829A055|nr:DUF2690 domain-containing protein [Nocardia xishanensis]
MTIHSVMKFGRGLALLSTAAVLALGGLVANAPTSNAVTCYGDYCSGQDPLASGCAAGAYTVAVGNVYGTGGTQYVEIRWSPTCQTNWARSNIVSSQIKAVQEGGYTQGYSTNNGSQAWSKMIYSPVKCVKGVIWGSWGTTETWCV